MTHSQAAQRHPGLELLLRYRDVFAAAWARRHDLVGPARLTDEAAFLPAALSLQETPVHPAPRRLACTIIMLFAILVAWSIVGRVDIVAVAPGRIVVSERTKVVQPLERSVVQRILIKDGDHVEAEQALVELDPTSATADRTSIHEALKSAQSDHLIAQALLRDLSRRGVADSLDGVAAVLTKATVPDGWTEADVHDAQTKLLAERANISARLASSAADILHRQAEAATMREVIAKLEGTLPHARQRESDFGVLAAQGDISRHASQDRVRERIEMERDLAMQRARLKEAQAAVRESEFARAAYVAETLRALRQRETEAALKQNQATLEEAKAHRRERLTILKAPVAGIIQQLAVHTEGGVVTEAQPLLVVVPDQAQVSAEVMLENKDIGFVHRGQNAEVKLETFPYTRYGTVAAIVQSVTADAVTDEKRGAVFPVVLSLATGTIAVDGQPVRLSPGMNLTAEIKTGRRRVIDYLLSPVHRAAQESLRER
ncbi:HlyD family type I secretion periplasmic adaptor subunit [uncultured Pseudacidovorax sp.]|uniref:HlyD family type I secretion periplasmic adaptor subunit n=1 Tax=uncultured Pseudacidovorax sp. TaxID=679313 RepID=UPI0025EA8180|nr:HlyD family type I secretion periplasmic adaptor subunit [uncultured Pseudacidovorax sp.]